MPEISENPVNDDDLDAPELINRFKSTHIYSDMMQTPVPPGEFANSLIIRILLRTKFALNPVLNYINRSYAKTTAVDLFRKETGEMLARYNQISGFFESLFDELVRIVEAVGSVSKETNESAAKIIGSESPSEVTIKKVKLEKNKPEIINKAESIKITVGNHVFNITVGKNLLKVTCPTSNSPEGIKMEIVIEKGELYAIERSKREVMKLLELNYQNALEEIKQAEREYYRHSSISKVSRETQTALADKNATEERAAALKARLDDFEDSPLVRWFDEAETIVILIGFEEDGSVIITDEGKKGRAFMEVT